MIKVGVRNGEVVIRAETERDHRLLLSLLDPGWACVTVRGEDVTQEVSEVMDQLGEIEWSW